MRILFVGTAPSPSLDGMLVSGGFTLAYPKTLGSEPFAEMAFIVIQKTQQLDELAQWKKKNPKAWVVLLIERSHLKQTELQHALLAFDAKDSVQLKEIWESVFWFTLQAYFEAIKKEKKLEEQEKTFRNLNKQLQDLEAGTNKLLAHFEKDIEVAENIQRSLIKPHSTDIAGVQMAVKYLPSPGLGGDYYDVFEFGDKRRYGILLADSKTHGMAAALLNVLLKLKIEEMRHRFPDPQTLVGYLNQEIKLTFPKEPAPLHLLYGILDRVDLTFRYAAAGALRPVLWRAGKLEAVPVSSAPTLGMMDHYSFREERLQLSPSDLLLLHTDGLTAALAKEANSLEETLQSSELDPLSLQNNFLAKIHELTAEEGLPDDITLIQLLIEERALYLAQSR